MSLLNSQEAYAHADYAAALAEFGRPNFLKRSGGWILERPIPGTDFRDATGCYPVFACCDWTRIREDLEEIDRDLVSLVLVTDPFGRYSEDILRGTFNDLVVPFKQHFVVELDCPLGTFVRQHHQREARRGLKMVVVEKAANPADWNHTWQLLYSDLVKRHGITGLPAFSATSLEKQLQVPGAHLFRASREGEIVGMAFWFITGQEGYYHLAACNESGYRNGASYALLWRGLEYFQGNGIKRIALGAGAGSTNMNNDGLVRFKEGWATRTQTVFLCGRIFDRERYRSLALASNSTATYFPVYRQGEFA